MKSGCLMIALCLPLFFCGPARAQHAGPYVGAYLGGNILADSRASDDLGSFNLSFKPALQGNVVIGWELKPNSPLGEGRIELEYARRSNPLDRVAFSESKVKGSGDLATDSLLFNCIGVVPGGSSWSPYILVGIGAARIDASKLKVSGQPLSNDSATVFAYQLGGGFDYPLSGALSLDLGYRFFGSSQPQFTEANGHKFAADYFSHSVMLGLRLGF